MRFLPTISNLELHMQLSDPQCSTDDERFGVTDGISDLPTPKTNDPGSLDGLRLYLAEGVDLQHLAIR